MRHLIECDTSSRSSLIPLAQSVKIQISDAILTECVLFAHNSMTFSLANNFVSITSIYLSEFQFFIVVSTLKKHTVVAFVIVEFFALSRVIVENEIKRDIISFYTEMKYELFIASYVIRK